MLAGCPSPPAMTGTETGDEASSTTGVTGDGTTGDDVMTSTVASDSSSSSSSGEPAPTCEDGIQNQGESDLDCGGPCATCPVGQGCAGNEDCMSLACDGGTCVTPECLDAGDCPAQTGMCMGSVCKAFHCAVAPAFEGESCDDDDLCSVSSTCQSGACAPKESIDCSGLDSPCTQGQCDPSSGACLVGDLADGTSCDDGDSCTAASACKAGSCLPNGVGAVFFEDFSAAAGGWEFDELWEIGVAVPSASGVGGADPATDHSAGDDDMIAGTVIGGLDTSPGHARWCMSSPAIDTSKLAGALWVSFWRHLHAPAKPGVVHSVEVWDGAIWNTLETGYAALTNDAAWTFVKFDATGFQAKGFRVRICSKRVGATPDFAGWSIDDLTVAALPCTPG